MKNDVTEKDVYGQEQTERDYAPMKRNQFWKLRSKHGRDKIFQTPEILWEACIEYFEATDQRKWIRTEFNGKDAKKCEVPTDTPYTWTGLYLFLDIDHSTWQLYEKREDFIAIATRVRNIIYTQKMEGAAVGAFNANIIARDLGLRDQQNVNHEGAAPVITFQVEYPKEVDE